MPGIKHQFLWKDFLDPELVLPHPPYSEQEAISIAAAAEVMILIMSDSSAPPGEVQLRNFL